MKGYVLGDDELRLAARLSGVETLPEDGRGIHLVAVQKLLVPGFCERFAHVSLARIRGAFVVAREPGGFGVEIQGCGAALPGDACVEAPGGGEEEAGEEFGEA